jgi:uncharacterized membrane protein YgaE (UPF0421/DUF939 family)
MAQITFLQKYYPRSQIVRRALSTGIAIFCAVLADQYYSVLHELWVGIAAVLVLQMSIRTNVREELWRLFVVMTAVAFGTVLTMTIPRSIYLQSLFVFIFIVGCFIHNYFPAKARGISPALLIALVMLIMLAPFSNGANVMFDRLHDVVLGGVIAVIAGVVIFPGRADVDFRAGVVPVLEAYSHYLAALAALFFKENNAAESADKNKAAIEKVLQSRQVFFPAWVYDKGFNSKLREGHRHFLMRIEQMGQVLFAMNNAARYEVDAVLLKTLYAPLMRCVEDYKSLMADLITVLNKAEVTTSHSDFSADINELENIFKKEMAIPFELIETSPDYLHCASFIYGLKDLEFITSKLEEALRGYISHLAYE